ncbi:RrF2 family transcriptional regulator [Magnetospirillum sulfuroxidans]|uniref:Rrf2 family transcriptional regulator n=1 Tax=Magnetospirillum sulfuroxidans TaxID=611300 RepID=A0ABS5IGI0_9PROT|nr:Rrf2 family transcriptional regulator [Magnetospirillum sulfuroxidans]MBR9973520.1 Rrf2 family transcriptional regulator [Magnetospirillum sulfuroxidans]
MKITQFTDYSLRLLIYLAMHRDRVSTVREVSDFYSISSEHLKKIVRRLSELGHISTVRGKNGGLMLAREPSEINLGALLRQSENLNLVPCHEAGDTCPIAGCKLRCVIETARDAFLGVFDGKTLADIQS